MVLSNSAFYPLLKVHRSAYEIKYDVAITESIRKIFKKQV